jgi:hypothetical protein
LHEGEFTLTASLSPNEWTSVFGQRGAEVPSEFNTARAMAFMSRAGTPVLSLNNTHFRNEPYSQVMWSAIACGHWNWVPLLGRVYDLAANYLQRSLSVSTPPSHGARDNRQNGPTGGGYDQLAYDGAIVNAAQGWDQGLED